MASSLTCAKRTALPVLRVLALQYLSIFGRALITGLELMVRAMGFAQVKEERPKGAGDTEQNP